MRPYGSDRVRESGGRVILHSRLSKGWTPRTPKSATHSEFPGTAILWDDQYYEVIAAEPLPAGGVRYVLGPWKDENAMRVSEAYDDASEARLLEDYQKAMRQQKHSLAARWSGILLGHLPAPVQNHLGNELGVSPARMTLLSIVPSIALLATCVWLTVGAKMKSVPSPVPIALWVFALFMLFDSGVRFLLAMTQNHHLIDDVGFKGRDDRVGDKGHPGRIFRETMFLEHKEFVQAHPTVKVLALSFLMLIGMSLVGEGLGQHIPKGYIYFSMSFAFLVEMLNLKLRTKSKPVQLHVNVPKV